MKASLASRPVHSAPSTSFSTYMDAAAPEDTTNNLSLLHTCQLVRITRKPYGFLPFFHAYGRITKTLRIFLKKIKKKNFFFK